MMVPAGSRKDPYRQFRFRVEIDGITQAGFSECIFSDTTAEPLEHREGADSPVVRKLSGLARYGNITLRRGITDSTDLSTWRRQVIDTGAGKVRKNISIILVDEMGGEQARWDIFRAWPSLYDPPDFPARGSEAAIERLEIVHEGFRRVK